MAHPHEHLLQEYKISIDKLVPLTPPEVIEEAKKLYVELMENEGATERQIIQALIRIGQKEYPYRKAYEELCASDEEKRLNEAALAKLDQSILAKIKPALESGVHITDYTKSKLFEKALTGEERYRVETAVLEAHDVVGQQCDERSRERQQKFDELVTLHKKEEEKIQGLINQLRSMAERDDKWRSEIIGKADEFEEGWSIVERDPSEEEVRKEIENWTAVFEEHPEGQGEAEESTSGL